MYITYAVTPMTFQNPPKGRILTERAPSPLLLYSLLLARIIFREGDAQLFTI